MKMLSSLKAKDKDYRCENQKEARKLMQTDPILLLDKWLYAEQARRLENLEPTSNPEIVMFMRWMKEGPVIEPTSCIYTQKSPSSLENYFKNKVVRASNATQPVPFHPAEWCPIARSYINREFMLAVHIFHFAHGQDLMTEIFGPEADEHLYSYHNGMMMSLGAKERFDKGLFTIVPYLSDEASPAHIQNWHMATPQRYKIRVLDTTSKLMQAYTCSYREKRRRWLDLDGQELIFKNDHRPRACYLYFRFCVTMLSQSHKYIHRCSDKSHTNVLRDHLGKEFWAAPGPFLRKEYLLPFVTETGSKDFLQGANNPAKDAEPDPTVLAAANNSLKISLRLRPSQISSWGLCLITPRYRDPESDSDSPLDPEDSQDEYYYQQEDQYTGESHERDDDYLSSKERVFLNGR